MPLLPLIRSTFRTLTRGEDLERELDEELQSILGMLVDEKIGAGMDPGEARREALMELGGAEQVKLLSLVFGRSIRMIGAGLLLGVFASVFGARMVQGLLFRTDPLDPIAFLGATAFLGTVGLIACILPAWRAIQVNPVEVLRKE